MGRPAAGDAGARPVDLHDEKLLVTARALRLRRARPDVFVGEGTTYAAVVATSTGSALAFARGAASGGDSAPDVVVVATRLQVALERNGGWGAHTVALPEGRWRDELGGAEVEPGDPAPGDGAGDQGGVGRRLRAGPVGGVERPAGDLVGAFDPGMGRPEDFLGVPRA